MTKLDPDSDREGGEPPVRHVTWRLAASIAAASGTVALCVQVPELAAGIAAGTGVLLAIHQLLQRK